MGQVGEGVAQHSESSPVMTINSAQIENGSPRDGEGAVVPALLPAPTKVDLCEGELQPYVNVITSG